MISGLLEPLPRLTDAQPPEALKKIESPPHSITATTVAPRIKNESHAPVALCFVFVGRFSLPWPLFSSVCSSDRCAFRPQRGAAEPARVFLSAATLMSAAPGCGAMLFDVLALAAPPHPGGRPLPPRLPALTCFDPPPVRGCPGSFVSRGLTWPSLA